MPEKKVTTEKKTTAEKPVVKKTTVKSASPATKAKATVKKTTPVVEAKPVVVEKKIEPVVEAVKTPEKPAPAKVVKGKILKITLVKSGIGYSKTHKATLKALGFRHLNQTIQQVDSPSLRGMLSKVNHLVRIEEQVSK